MTASSKLIVLFDVFSTSVSMSIFASDNSYQPNVPDYPASTLSISFSYSSSTLSPCNVLNFFTVSFVPNDMPSSFKSVIPANRFGADASAKFACEPTEVLLLFDVFPNVLKFPLFQLFAGESFIITSGFELPLLGVSPFKSDNFIPPCAL